MKIRRPVSKLSMTSIAAQRGHYRTQHLRIEPCLHADDGTTYDNSDWRTHLEKNLNSLYRKAA